MSPAPGQARTAPRRAFVPSRLLACALFLGCRAAPHHDSARAARAEPGGSSLPSVGLGPSTASPGSIQSSVAPNSSVSGAPAVAMLAPLEAPGDLVILAVPGYREAIVSVPRGAREARPLVVALHGNFDRPEWQCGVWRGITAAESFVLCPRGIPRRDAPSSADRWEWGSLAATRAEIAAALGALSDRYAAYLRPNARIFAGFSLGAILGARLILDPQLDFHAAVLVEGGYANFNIAQTRAAAARLAHLIFACGQTECRNRVRSLEPRFTAAHLSFDVVADTKAGHTYDGTLAHGIAAKWPELIAKLP